MKKETLTLLEHMLPVSKSVVLETPKTVFIKPDKSMVGIIDLSDFETEDIPKLGIYDLMKFTRIAKMFSTPEGIETDFDGTTKVTFKNGKSVQEYQFTELDAMIGITHHSKKLGFLMKIILF